STYYTASSFSFQIHLPHRDLHSFPTRRSSDLLSRYTCDVTQDIAALADRAVGEGRGENETLERRAADVPRGYTAPRRMDIWIDCGERVPGHRILSPRTCGPRGFGRLQAPTRRLLWATSRPLV